MPQSKFTNTQADGRVAIYSVDYRLLEVRALRDYEIAGSGGVYGTQELTDSELSAAIATFEATPRLTYSPEYSDRSVAIPFSGFYESIWSGLVDDEESRFAEYEAEKEGDKEYHPETYQPESVLRMTESDFAELTMDHCSYSEAHEAIAIDYVDSFTDWLEQQIDDLIPGFGIISKFEIMTSPQEYNFETDRLFADMPYSSLERLYQLSEQNGHGALAYVIREKFTSYDGFRSHYSNDIDDWTSKHLSDWDHNELQTLLLASLALLRDGSQSNDLSWHVFDHGFSDGDNQYFENAMDWESYEKALAEKRAEKLAEAIEAGDIDPDIEPPYRCPVTTDLFEGAE